jgi:hypothetical protein
MSVIDTDILIDHFHGNVSATEFIQKALFAGDTLVISVATVAEILAGLRPGEEEDTEALLSLFHIYPAGEDLARIAGTYLNRQPIRSGGLVIFLACHIAFLHF